MATQADFRKTGRVERKCGRLDHLQGVINFRNEGRQYLLKPCSCGCIEGLAERLLHAGELQFGKHQDLPNGIVQLETQPLSFLGSHSFSNVIGVVI